jgi:hypothetical protein
VTPSGAPPQSESFQAPGLVGKTYAFSVSLHISTGRHRTGLFRPRCIPAPLPRPGPLAELRSEAARRSAAQPTAVVPRVDRVTAPFGMGTSCRSSHAPPSDSFGLLRRRQAPVAPTSGSRGLDAPGVPHPRPPCAPPRHQPVRRSAAHRTDALVAWTALRLDRRRNVVPVDGRAAGRLDRRTTQAPGAGCAAGRVKGA